MASKWGVITAGLPAEPLEPNRQLRIDRLRLLLGQLKIDELAHRYIELRREKDAAEAVLSGVQERLDAISQTLVEAYEKAGISNLKLATGESVAVQPEPHAAVENAAVLRAWCLTEDLQGLMSLPWQTLNSLAKERLLAGDPAPPGTKLYVRTKIVLRGRTRQTQGSIDNNGE